MIVFESILTTFEASFVFWGSWGSSKNRHEPKTLTSIDNFSLLKSVICTLSLNLIIPSNLRFQDHFCDPKIVTVIVRWRWSLFKGFYLCYKTLNCETQMEFVFFCNPLLLIQVSRKTSLGSKLAKRNIFFLSCWLILYAFNISCSHWRTLTN